MSRHQPMPYCRAIISLLSDVDNADPSTLLRRFQQHCITSYCTSRTRSCCGSRDAAGKSPCHPLVRRRIIEVMTHLHHSMNSLFSQALLSSIGFRQIPCYLAISLLEPVKCYTDHELKHHQGSKLRPGTFPFLAV